MRNDAGYFELTKSSLVRETPICYGIFNDVSDKPGTGASIARTLSYPSGCGDHRESYEDADCFGHRNCLSDSLCDRDRWRWRGVFSPVSQGLVWQ